MLRFIELLLLPALLFLHACNEKTVIKDIDTDDFRFKKIQSFIDDSAHYFKAIDSVYDDLPPLKRAYQIYNNRRGYFYTYKRDREKALLYADSSLLLLNEYKNTPEYTLWYPRALSLKADDLHALKRYSEAFTYYYLAREAIYKSGNECLYADYSAKLGMVSYRHRQYKEAIEYFKQAAKQKTACKEDDNIDNDYVLFANHQSNLDNIGLCYSRLGIHDSAIYYFDSTLRYIELNRFKAIKYDKNNKKINDTDFVQSAIGVVYGNMATDLRAVGNDTATERLLRASIAINSEPHRATEDVPYSQSKLADLYITQLRLNEAHVVLDSLKQLLDIMPNAELLQRWYNLKAKYASAGKDYSTANNYLSKFITIKDSLNAIERERLAIDINQTFSFLKSQNELYFFKQDDERKRFYISLLGLAVIAVVVVSLLIWGNYKQSKKHVKTLGELNERLHIKQNHLEKTLVALQSSHDDNSKLMKIVAHDLRNPIAGIAGVSDFLLKENSYGDLERKMLEMIRESSYHSIELIQELLNVNSNVNDLKKEPIDLYVLINYCIEMLQIKADKKSQTIKADIAAVKVIGDREKLWRVFTNLLGNAVKFSPQNEHIEISTTVKDKHVVIGIKDNGIGIPEGFREKIFKMDPDIKRKGTLGESSFGFGLAICKQIIANHGGDIWFESMEDKGTVFYVSLPIAA
ncbi:tetratricopeptide repeat-containing sensor histidine kinase [Terrimonas sp.]|uniref:tetratricopeptide repeat-containing sensor histidine kinase n=1 Tax=Terrimonas sp. TaxID=1914338 RepID=UPI0014037276|nr:tetratricopeptide repeat-containing sensor histidine kinase [Terrimonas sp.]